MAKVKQDCCVQLVWLRFGIVNAINWSRNIKAIPLTYRKEDKKAEHLRCAESLFRQARVAIEANEDWQASGSLILKGLAEERKANNTGVQVMNVIRVRPKTKLEFSFRS